MRLEIDQTKFSHPSDAELYPTHSFCLEQQARGTLAVQTTASAGPPVAQSKEALAYTLSQ